MLKKLFLFRGRIITKQRISLLRISWEFEEEDWWEIVSDFLTRATKIILKYHAKKGNIFIVFLNFLKFIKFINLIRGYKISKSFKKSILYLKYIINVKVCP